MLSTRPRVAFARFLIIVGIVVAWDLASRTFIDPFYISQPFDVAERLWDWVSTGDIVEHVLATMSELVFGLVIGVVLGVLVALILGSSPTLAAVFRPFVTVAYSFPQLAVTPLYILWFGVFLMPKVVLISVVVFFLMFFNTFEGVKNVEGDLIAAMRVMGAKRFDVFRIVVLPASAVFLITGLRHAVPFALRAAVFGEFLASVRGVGFLAVTSARSYCSAGLFAALASTLS
ncbi:MAG: ABC transporter permease subunit [Acidimicrobiia bacterium]|nr:ABC transporter permease subunit [Acidimicrobiia bacterium]